MTANNFPNDDIMAAFGFNAEDPEVAAAMEDAEAQSRLMQTLIGLRRDQHLTQRDVAQRMDTTQSRVSDIERLGGNPTLMTLFRYARAINAKLCPMVRPTASVWERAETISVSTSTSDDNIVVQGDWTAADVAEALPA